MANPVGRPTKYTPEMLGRARYYARNYDNEDIGDAIPSISGLAFYLKIARETFYAWARQEEKAEFSDLLDGILAAQERVLINKGLTGDFNSNIVKLVLGKHGYHDRIKSETDVTGGITVVMSRKDIGCA